MVGWLSLIGLGKHPFPVANGYSFVDRCPRCALETRFREVEIRRGFVLFDLPGSGALCFRCETCGFVPVEQRRSRRAKTRH